MGKKKFKLSNFIINFVLLGAIIFGMAFPFLPKQKNIAFAEPAPNPTQENFNAQVNAITELITLTQSDGQKGVKVNKNSFKLVNIPIDASNNTQNVVVVSVVGNVSINPKVSYNQNGEPSSVKPVCLTQTSCALENTVTGSGYFQYLNVSGTGNTFYSTFINEPPTSFGFIKQGSSDTPKPISLGTEVSGADVFTQIKVRYNPTTAIEGADTKEYTFYIYQANSLKYDNNGISWHIVSVAEDFTTTEAEILQPGENQAYSDKVVLIIDARQIIRSSAVNKMYVDYWCNGEAYSIKIERTSSFGENGVIITNNYYDKLDEYFNNQQALAIANGKTLLDSQTRPDALAENVTDNIKSGNTITLTFDVSGEYKVRIYDDTYTGEIPSRFNEDVLGGENYPLANMLEYNFIVENKTNFGGFYVTVKSADHDDATKYNNHIVSYDIVSSFTNNSTIQRVNRPVLIEFHNINPSYIEEIRNEAFEIENKGNVKKNPYIYYHQGLSSEADEYYNIDPILLTEEASYNIQIRFCKNSFYERTQVIRFQLLNSVRSVYDFEGVQYPKNNETLQYNIVKTERLQQEHLATKNDSEHLYYSTNNLFGYVNSEFKLYLAKSNANISGVENKRSVNGEVELNITGVAAEDIGMRIIVKRDGNTILDTLVYNHNETSALTYNLKYSDLGNYTVQVIDGMNNSTKIQFKITQKQNAAGIILIAVGCIVAAGIVFFIIKARSKVAVR